MHAYKFLYTQYPYFIVLVIVVICTINENGTWAIFTVSDSDDGYDGGIGVSQDCRFKKKKNNNILLN